MFLNIDINKVCVNMINVIAKEIRKYHEILLSINEECLYFQIKCLICCFYLEPTQAITTTLIQSTESSMQSSSQQACTMSKCQLIDFHARAFVFNNAL